MNPLPKIEPITTQLLPAPTDADRAAALALFPKRQLRAEEQSGVQIANLLSALDGSLTRACIDCGEIYKVSRPDSRIYRCNGCQGKAEDGACCDSPHYRTIGARSHPDGTTFSKRYCQSCGRTVEVES